MVKISLLEGNLEMSKKIKEGLCVEGLDIKKDLTNEHVSLVDCEIVWGKKSSYGFKVDKCNDVNLISKVLKLYPIVYQGYKITNNTIGLSFANGLLVGKKRHKS
jgi:hypothetical protein